MSDRCILRSEREKTFQCLGDSDLVHDRAQIEGGDKVILNPYFRMLPVGKSCK